MSLWRRSSRSNGSGGNNCVEVAFLEDEPTGARGVGVRDSKDPAGPLLVFTPDEWAAFVAGVKEGEFG